jgi:hypothetical protein
VGQDGRLQFPKRPSELDAQFLDEGLAGVGEGAQGL